MTGNLFDATNIPDTEPSSFRAGDLTQWRRDDLVTDYPTATYQLRYVARLHGEEGVSIVLNATEDADGYLVSISSVASALYDPGLYDWELFVIRSSDSERIHLDGGQWTILEDAEVDRRDPSSHARTMLSKIESILENRADSDVDNYAIGGRSITKMGVEELIKWRSYYRSEVEAEDDLIRRSRGEPTRNAIQMRFNNA